MSPSWTLITVAAMACMTIVAVVRITGTTTGIVDIGRAIGALIAEILTGFGRHP